MKDDNIEDVEQDDDRRPTFGGGNLPKRRRRNRSLGERTKHPEGVGGEDPIIRGNLGEAISRRENDTERISSSDEAEDITDVFDTLRKAKEGEN